MSIQLGYAHLSVIPVRSKPGHREEMINQLLFGEEYEILEENEEWAHIISIHDSYHGWIQKQQLCLKSADTDTIHHPRFYVSETVVDARSLKIAGKKISLVYGTRLHNLDGEVLHMQDEDFAIGGHTALISPPVNGSNLVTTAMNFLGVPYLWGGRTPFGIDCSGLTQVVFQVHGISIPRDARMQAELGNTVSFEECKAGDLGYFGDSKEKITHVGIIAGNNLILHASGVVHLSSFHEQGVLDKNQKVTHKLQVIKRMLNK